MEFFNKKEEVLDLQLTEYGKYLLSQGRMKPVYYAFYDDEILYDIAAGPSAEISGSEAGTAENQKDADRRIRYETPNLKPQSNTTGVETRVKQFLKTVTENINKQGLSSNSINFADAFDSVPQFGQKFFVASAPLGTSDLKSSYDAAWGISFLHNEISSSQNYYTVNLTSSAAALNNGVIKEIPQLDVVIDYKMFYTHDLTPSGDFSIVSTANDQGINISLQNNFILIDLQEHNTAYEKDNFYCEVFISGSDTGLQQISFAEEELTPATRDQIEYYLSLDVDAEIALGPSAAYGLNQRAITHNEGLTPGEVPTRSASGARLRLEGDIYDDFVAPETDDAEKC